MIEVPKVEGEVQRWELTQHWRGYESWETMEKDPDGEWIRAEDYAALNEYSALVEMGLRAEVERLREAIKTLREERDEQAGMREEYQDWSRFDSVAESAITSPSPPTALWDRECVRCGHKWKDLVHMALPCPACEPQPVPKSGGVQP